MAKSDRTLTLDEIFRGDISSEYLDRKERKAIIERHLRRLSIERDAIEDKIEICGSREDLIIKHNKIIDKINKLAEEIGT